MGKGKMTEIANTTNDVAPFVLSLKKDSGELHRYANGTIVHYDKDGTPRDVYTEWSAHRTLPDSYENHAKELKGKYKKIVLVTAYYWVPVMISGAFLFSYTPLALVFLLFFPLFALAATPYRYEDKVDKAIKDLKRLQSRYNSPYTLVQSGIIRGEDLPYTKDKEIKSAYLRMLTSHPDPKRFLYKSSIYRNLVSVSEQIFDLAKQIDMEPEVRASVMAIWNSPAMEETPEVVTEEFNNLKSRLSHKYDSIRAAQQLDAAEKSKKRRAEQKIQEEASKQYVQGILSLVIPENETETRG